MEKLSGDAHINCPETIIKTMEEEAVMCAESTAWAIAFANKEN